MFDRAFRSGLECVLAADSAHATYRQSEQQYLGPTFPR
jgi:hypothetical protein